MISNGCLNFVRNGAAAALAVGAILGLSVLPSAVSAGDGPGGYPKRQITIIVCFGAGGGSDQMARAMGAAAEKSARCSGRGDQQEGCRRARLSA